MTVSQWLQTNFSSQTSTVYKGAIDGNFAAIKRGYGDMFAPYGSTAAMVVNLDAGHVFNGVTLTEIGAQASSTITAPVTNPRIDRIVIDQTTGIYSVITGTPSTAPTAPAITAGKCPVAQIALTSLTTSITNSLITDERDFTGLGSGSTTPPYGVTTGGTTTYAVTTSPSFSSLTTGRLIEVKINAANTGSMTINANTLGAITCKDNFGNNLTAGAVLANSTYQFVYDGTNFILINRTPAYVYLPWAADTGSSNNYAVTPVPAITALSTGINVLLKPSAANSSTGCTITVAGSTVPQAIKMLDGSDPYANAMLTTGFSHLVMNSSFFTLVNPAPGTVAKYDVGTSANNIVQLNGSAQLPAVDGSLLTGLLVAKAKVKYATTGGTVSIAASVGVTSVTYVNTGHTTVTLTSAPTGGTDFITLGTAGQSAAHAGGNQRQCSCLNTGTTTIDVQTVTGTGAYAESAQVCIAVY